MTAGGHFNVHRVLFDSDLKPTKRDPACKAFAWVWVIGLARWRKSGDVKRGEFRLSVRVFAAEMCWSKTAAERFLDKLVFDGRLVVLSGTVSGTPSGTPQGRHFRVVKYEDFQTSKTSSGTLSGTVSGPIRRKKEGRRKDNGVAETPKSVGGDAVLTERPVTKKRPAAKKPASLLEQRDFPASEIRKSVDSESSQPPSTTTARLLAAVMLREKKHGKRKPVQRDEGLRYLARESAKVADA